MTGMSVMEGENERANKRMAKLPSAYSVPSVSILHQVLGVANNPHIIPILQRRNLRHSGVYHMLKITLISGGTRI